MFFLIDPLKNANWGKEFTPSMYICCFRLMICLLKTPLHLQARCFFSHQCQKSNSSESSQTWGFWHPSYPGNKNIKTIFFFSENKNVFIFFRILLLKHKKHLQVPLGKITFLPHFWILMSWVGERRKKESKKLLLTYSPLSYCFKKMLLVKFNKNNLTLLGYMDATWHFCKWSNCGKHRKRTKLCASAEMPEKG